MISAAAPPDAAPAAREECLRRDLAGMGRVLVAFSGGVDSAYLLWAAREALGPKRVAAATVDAPYVGRAEIAGAGRLARELGVSHHLLPMPFPEALDHNPPQRCYVCKGLILTRLGDLAGRQGLGQVVDGSNRDDLDEHRPGFLALAEHGVPSPLLAAGLTKADIRALSRRRGLPTWDKPAMTCLLTRLPHGATVDPAVLRRIEDGEGILGALGFAGARLRLDGDAARIEVPRERIPDLVAASAAHDLPGRLEALGFRRVSVDLAGYRRGGQGGGVPAGEKES